MSDVSRVRLTPEDRRRKRAVLQANQQKKIRDRGGRRISAYLTPDAAKALDILLAAGSTQSEIISKALVVSSFKRP